MLIFISCLCFLPILWLVLIYPCHAHVSCSRRRRRVRPGRRVPGRGRRTPRCTSTSPRSPRTGCRRAVSGRYARSPCRRWGDGYATLTLSFSLIIPIISELRNAGLWTDCRDITDVENGHKFNQQCQYWKTSYKVWKMVLYFYHF